MDGSSFVPAEPVHIFLITYPMVFEYVLNMDYSSQLFISGFYRMHASHICERLVISHTCKMLC